ncbi:MAG: choline-sulfatase [Rhodobacteraceae bacterium]|nr:choline-sulfatase [Paracoccaceae bacterium]
MKQPNILIFMVDQLNGTLFPDGPAAFLQVPNLRKLAARATRFQNAYCASPLCAPSRASFMSGQLPSRTRVYDNAAEFSSDIPTYAHHLRRAGYSTVLSGKMHFVGPDQLHGFEQRLTTDVYPADFGWTPDYRKPGERIDWWYHNMGSVTGAGVAETSNQLEYDDDVTHQAKLALYEHARREDGAPLCLTVSFTHPHDPYVARKKFWDMYPETSAHYVAEGMEYAEHDAHSKRIFDANDWRNFTISDDNIARSRRAYFANISYVDDNIGQIMSVLEDVRMQDDTIIIFCSDHGDMLGERGLWFKMSFFEGSARVPLMVALPGQAGRSVATPVSLLDVVPTLADLAGIDLSEIKPWTDGQSVRPLMEGADERSAPVYMEYAAEASYAPLVSIREGCWKFNHCTLDPPQLYNLAQDPGERVNLADDPAHEALVAGFMQKVHARWDIAQFDAAIRESQARRLVVYAALRNGDYYPWDYQPLRKASERYMRNHLDLNVLEANKRFPRGD